MEVDDVLVLHLGEDVDLLLDVAHGNASTRCLHPLLLDVPSRAESLSSSSWSDHHHFPDLIIIIIIIITIIIIIIISIIIITIIILTYLAAYSVLVLRSMTRCTTANCPLKDFDENNEEVCLNYHITAKQFRQLQK